MKSQVFIHLTFFFIIALCAFSANAQTTAFTYQGRLTDGSDQTPTAEYDLQFNLFSVQAGGSPLNNSPIVIENISVNDGLFAVQLDFGSLFDGTARFMEISLTLNEKLK
ncbi:MAG: hypothetical protein M3209_18795 [Acidobacteriota bacterium]|nr:hypothetical protein [Acidobacteriota bacterium]